MWSPRTPLVGPSPRLSPLQGLTRVKNATDAVGIVLKELKSQSRSGAFRLLVAVDGANALWGRTTLKREDKSLVGNQRFSVTDCGRRHACAEPRPWEHVN